jgi:hypothetical protein
MYTIDSVAERHSPSPRTRPKPLVGEEERPPGEDDRGLSGDMPMENVAR